MKSRTIGELLQVEREQRGLSLEHVAKETKVKLEYLQALEAGELTGLPPAPFVKGYLRAYARVLDLESDDLIAVLRRDYKQDFQGQLIARSLNGQSRAKLWLGISISWGGLVAAGFFISLVSYGLFLWYQITRPPHLDVIEPQDQAAVASRVVVKGYVDQDALLLVNEAPVALNPDGFFQTTVEFPDAGLSLIKVEAFDDANRSTKLERMVFVEF